MVTEDFKTASELNSDFFDKIKLNEYSFFAQKISSDTETEIENNIIKKLKEDEWYKITFIDDFAPEKPVTSTLLIGLYDSEYFVSREAFGTTKDTIGIHRSPHREDICEFIYRDTVSHAKECFGKMSFKLTMKKRPELKSTMVPIHKNIFK